MTLLRALVRDAAVAVIAELDTLAGPFVFSSRDTNVQQGDVPAVLVYVLSEHGEGTPASGVPRFTTTLTLMVECITASADKRTCETDLDTLSEQVTEGLLTSLAFVSLKNPASGGRLFEGFSNLSTTLHISGATDRHIGSARIAIGIRYHDVYVPVITQPLETIALNTDAIDVADLAGTYVAANPGPRAAGPDGRIEIGGLVTLPQPTP